MQEAAQQPISFKRSYSIADWSTSPVGELMSKVTARSGTMGSEAPSDLASLAYRGRILLTHLFEVSVRRRHFPEAVSG
jgi:hypothetical protein